MKYFSRSILLIYFLIFVEYGWCDQKKNLFAVAYYQKLFGHIYQSASISSPSLSTLRCGQPVKVFIAEKNNPRVKTENEDWSFVHGNGYDGHVLKKFLGPKRPVCFQDKYPQFFSSLNLDLTETYYWGRLYDQYILFKTQIR